MHTLSAAAAAEQLGTAVGVGVGISNGTGVALGVDYPFRGSDAYAHRLRDALGPRVLGSRGFDAATGL